MHNNAHTDNDNARIREELELLSEYFRCTPNIDPFFVFTHASALAQFSLEVLRTTKVKAA